MQQAGAQNTATSVRDSSVKPNGTSWFNSFGNPGTTTSTSEPAQQALSPEKS